MTTYVRRGSRQPKKRAAIDVYTDGACSAEGNTGRGPGGWAWAFSADCFGQGGAKSTTNQRMELQAVLEGLRYWFAIKPSTSICVVTDSAYVMNCFRDRWHLNWKNGMKRKTGEPVANWDIWSDLIPLVLEHDVTWRKVKGHSGDPGNEYVDQLAVEAKRRFQ